LNCHQWSTSDGDGQEDTALCHSPVSLNQPIMTVALPAVRN